MRPILLAGLASALLAGACVPQYTSPQQMRASNPTVTYKYHNDGELLTVNQTAATFCTQYGSTARAAAFTNEPDGKVVVFECAPPAAVVAASPGYNPNLTYNYQTDPELLSASQSAQSYCQSTGSGPAIANIVTNSNGTRTVTFQCSRI